MEDEEDEEDSSYWGNVEPGRHDEGVEGVRGAQSGEFGALFVSKFLSL